MNRGAPNGPSRREPFDRWFRYPAGFSPIALERCFEALGVEPGAVVVDPFAGVATSGTAARARGLAYRGLEVHPLIAELARLKFARPGDTAALVTAAEELSASAEAVEIECEHDLVRRCFDDAVLEQLAGLREAVEKSTSPWAVHLKWALLGMLRELASSKVGWPYQRPALKRKPQHARPAERFIQRAGLIADDLAALGVTGDSTIVAGDAREETAWHEILGEEKAAACISSPPYLNNFDYADATRLELYFWGAARNWAEMCRTVRAGMVVSTTQQSSVVGAQVAKEALACWPKTFAVAKRLEESLAGERRRHARGKEYDRVLPAYLAGMAAVLEQMLACLMSGAKAAWVIGDSAPYGIYVDTPALIALLAQEVGFIFEVDVTIRSRGQRWRTNGTRHEVPLSERLVVLRRP